MNTFLPSPDFTICARVLDMKRLNRQMSEVEWIAAGMTKRPGNTSISSKYTGGHPVYGLWTSSLGTQLIAHLRAYQLALGEEWKRATRRDHLSVVNCRWMDEYELVGRIVWPESVHLSHRVNLLKKDKRHYANKFFLFDLHEDEEYIPYDWSNPTTV